MNCEQKSVELYLPVAYSNVGGTVETITKTRLHAHSLNPLHIRWVGVRRYSVSTFCYHNICEMRTRSSKPSKRRPAPRTSRGSSATSSAWTLAGVTMTAVIVFFLFSLALRLVDGLAGWTRFCRFTPLGRSLSTSWSPATWKLPSP